MTGAKAIASPILHGVPIPPPVSPGAVSPYHPLPLDTFVAAPIEVAPQHHGFAQQVKLCSEMFQYLEQIVGDAASADTIHDPRLTSFSGHFNMLLPFQRDLKNQTIDGPHRQFWRYVWSSWGQTEAVCGAVPSLIRDGSDGVLRLLALVGRTERPYKELLHYMVGHPRNELAYYFIQWFENNNAVLEPTDRGFTATLRDDTSRHAALFETNAQWPPHPSDDLHLAGVLSILRWGFSRTGQQIYITYTTNHAPLTRS